MRPAPASSSDRPRVAVVGLAAVGLLVAGGFGWASTRLGEYSVMTMGHVVDGRGGSSLGTGSGHPGAVHPGGSADATAGTAGAAAPAPGASGPPGTRTVPRRATSSTVTSAGRAGSATRVVTSTGAADPDAPGAGAAAPPPPVAAPDVPAVASADPPG